MDKFPQPKPTPFDTFMKRCHPQIPDIEVAKKKWEEIENKCDDEHKYYIDFYKTELEEYEDTLDKWAIQRVVGFIKLNPGLIEDMKKEIERSKESDDFFKKVKKSKHR